MYKCVWLIRFRPDLDPAEVRERWRTSHGALALEVPGIRRYVQNHWVAETDGFGRGWDGSVDVWFDDRAAFDAALASPEWAALLEDDARLFDRSDTPAFAGGVVEEYVMRWDARPDQRPYKAAGP
jgi:uncharacterized protein (TIGR02118 family)